MERVPVISSNIVSAGYDAESQTLEIEFKGGTVYQYYSFPQTEFDAFLGANSKGSHFHAFIKDRYATARL